MGHKRLQASKALRPMSLYRFLLGQVVIYGGCLHLLWAALLLTGASPRSVTAIAELSKLFHTRPVLTALLALVGTLALWGAFLPVSPMKLLMLLPQQFFLSTSAIGAVTAIVQGHFADGVARPRAFLAADQLGLILVALLHTVVLMTLNRQARG